MSDAPPTESTPTEAPAPVAAPAPAEPAPAAPPAEAAPAEPTAAPSEYPVEATPADKSAATSVFRGQSFNMTQAQLDTIIHEGLSAIELRQGQPAPTAPPVAPPVVEEDEVGGLRKELAELRQTINASTYEQRVHNETARINAGLDGEIAKHKVFTENPELSEVGRKSALALLSHNPRISEADAMKSVANDFGAALNKRHEAWIKGKVGDAENAEAGPGGQPGGSPSPKGLTGRDLMRGRVRDAALRRLGEKDLIT